MWDPFWTFGPRIDVGSSMDAAEANTKANAAQRHARELERRIEHLAMACNAMWNLLKTQTGLTDEQLKEKMQQLQAASATAQPANCPACGRRISPRQGKCIYCGEVNANVSAFEGR
jgi:hypothetical protein